MLSARTAVAITISIVPLQIARRLLYSTLLGYRIANGAKIGFLTIIAVDRAEIGVATFGMFNRFVGPYSLTVGTGTSIARGNVFFCGRWAKEEKFRGEKYERFCNIGEHCVITSAHLIDTTGGF